MATVEQPVQNFKVERSVLIGLDALKDQERKAIGKILESKESFVAKIDQGRRLAEGSRFFSLPAPGGLRIIYSKDQNNIVVVSLMLEEVLDQYGPTPGINARKPDFNKSPDTPR